MDKNISSIYELLLPINTPVRRMKNLAINLGTMSSVVIDWYKNEREFWSQKDAPITFRRGNLEMKIRKDVIEIKFNNRKALFHYDSAKQFINTLGLLNYQFLKEEYAWLKVDNKVVVDVGANICDSSIYFVAKGAKHVYSLEPFPYSYRLGRKNIRLSNMDNRITLLNEACAGKTGFIKMDDSLESFSNADLKHGSGKVKVRATTLGELVSRYKLENSVLKMDCEGAEREILLNTADDTLRAFSQIMLEYHYGYKDIEERLKRAGFKVRHTWPIRSFNAEAKNPNMILGLIYAHRPR
jgi:FkbM family methyltransferase